MTKEEIFNQTTVFLLLAILFSISFTGSMVSIATVEMAEAEEMMKEEIRLIKMDSSRISKVKINVMMKGVSTEMDCANQVIADQFLKQEKIRYFFGILPVFNQIDFLNLPNKIVLLIGATFMGLLGSIITLIKEATYDELKFTPKLIMKRSALGFCSGLLVIVLSYVLPGVITFNSDVDVQIESLTAFSLLAGMFFKRFIEGVSNKIGSDEK